MPSLPDAVAVADAADAADTGETAAPLSCNGSPLLCDRRLDQISLVATHNAMSNAAEGWQIPNQNLGMLQQLRDGVRGFLIDIKPYDGDEPALQGQLALCHGPCAFGAERLVEGLLKFKTFFAEDPGAFVVFVLEDHAPTADIDVALAEAGLRDLCHQQDPEQPWPTLRQMLGNGKRLFIMTESGGGPQPWNHAYAVHAWDTKYAAKTPDELSCDRLRGKESNSLFLINHFLSNPVGSPKLAAQVNHQPFLGDRVAKCRDRYQRLPNLVAVDFYDIGDILPVVRALNGLP